MTKGFIQKHTAKELQRKADAHRNMGGGLAGTLVIDLVCITCIILT